jgi:hypothetical protein
LEFELRREGDLDVIYPCNIDRTIPLIGRLANDQNNEGMPGYGNGQLRIRDE